LDTPIEARRLSKKLRFVLLATNYIWINRHYLFTLLHYYLINVAFFFYANVEKMIELFNQACPKSNEKMDIILLIALY
jgi:hypothetical protein